MNTKLTLSTPLNELETQLLETNDSEELKEIIDLFNLNIKKKDLARTSRLNSLQDKVCDQMEKRIDKRADEFSNKDLLDFYKVLQDTINKSSNTSNDISIPQIQVNQVNIGSEAPMSRESKQRVTDAVKAILEKINQETGNSDIIESEYIDIEEVEEEKEN